MTTTAASSSDPFTPPPKGVLKPRDPNITLNTPAPKKSAHKTPRGTPGRKTPGRGLFSPTLPLKQRKLGLKERAEKFELVCKWRVGEDIDGDLCEEGIQEWSLDDFDHVRKLGSGGVANVYLALEKESGHAVALKVQQANESAFCEVDLHMELVPKHPNILKMVDYFCTYEKFGPEEDEVPNCEEEEAPHLFLYSILEVCEGGDLYEAIDTHYCNVPEKLAAKYLLDAIAALELVHAEKIIHCDVKPANFLIDNHKNNTLKLADFGMAVRIEEIEVLGGSPVYMAPEHLMAWKHNDDPVAHGTFKFDHRVDIYSLGVVLYEILWGCLPYDVKGHKRGDEESASDLAAKLEGLDMEDSDDDSDIGYPVLDLRKVNGDEPFVLPPPIFDGDDISEEAQDLILRFLEADPDKRITLAEAKEHAWFKMHQD